MNLPFTTDQFLEVFAQYNLSIWPAQVLINLLALAALGLVIRKNIYSDQMINGFLAFFWIWMGGFYHLKYFSPINKAAYAFGALFILQGILFLVAGVFRKRLIYKPPQGFLGWLGGLFILYGMVVYPILGYLLGHVFPQAPTFGVPCPTTIFTFGILLWTGEKFSKHILAIPFLWSLIGFTAVLSLGIKEDIGLLVAGLVGSGAILYRDGKGKGKEKKVSTALEPGRLGSELQGTRR